MIKDFYVYDSSLWSFYFLFLFRTSYFLLYLFIKMIRALFCITLMVDTCLDRVKILELAFLSLAEKGWDASIPTLPELFYSLTFLEPAHEQIYSTRHVRSLGGFLVT